jgi:hypothetical protein
MPGNAMEEAVVPGDTLVAPVTNKTVPFKTKTGSVNEAYLMKAAVNLDADGNDSLAYLKNLKDKTGLPEPAEITVDEFYEKIEKQGQEFTLGSESGGLIKCLEGTSLVIPPAAFTDEHGNSISGEIKITVVEYYKYSEMVAANLSTMSDGRQLITGGMIRVTATSKGMPVKLRSDKFIDLTMPAKDYDMAMQLFIPATEKNKIPAGYAGDYLTDDPNAPAKKRTINWQVAGRQSTIPVFAMMTNFMNMQNEPSAVRGRNGGTAIFKIPTESPYSVAEAKQILQEKYGADYRRITVKKVKKLRREFNFFGPKRYVVKALIGDSVRLTLDEALHRGFIENKDSAFYAEKIRRDSMEFYRNYFANVFSGTGQSALRSDTISLLGDKFTANYQEESVAKNFGLYVKTQQTYNFRIQNLGWINCDRFAEYGIKADFVINLPEGLKADNFVSQLVFTNIRSVLPGRNFENKLGFPNVPVNMPVYLVGLGEKDGKVVSFMEKLKTGRNEVYITNFEETTAEAFKNKLAVLDLQ